MLEIKELAPDEVDLGFPRNARAFAYLHGCLIGGFASWEDAYGVLADLLLVDRYDPRPKEAS